MPSPRTQHRLTRDTLSRLQQTQLSSQEQQAPTDDAVSSPPAQQASVLPGIFTTPLERKRRKEESGEPLSSKKQRSKSACVIIAHLLTLSSLVVSADQSTSVHDTENLSSLQVAPSELRCSFLSLPLEIRQHIYNYCFRSKRNVVHYQFRGANICETELPRRSSFFQRSSFTAGKRTKHGRYQNGRRFAPYQYPICMLNRQIQDEFLDEYWSRKHVHINSTDEFWGFMDRHARCATKVRTLTVNFTRFRSKQDPYDLMILLQDAFKSLVTLEIWCAMDRWILGPDGTTDFRRTPFYLGLRPLAKLQHFRLLETKQYEENERWKKEHPGKYEDGEDLEDHEDDKTDEDDMWWNRFHTAPTIMEDWARKKLIAHAQAQVMWQYLRHDRY